MPNGLQKLFGGDGSPENSDETLAFIENPDNNGRLEMDTGEAQDESDIELLEAPSDGPTNGAASDQATDAIDVRDRVVKRLLAQDTVSRVQVRESMHQWSRNGEQETLWRVLARHPKVDRETVYAEAARIYAFRESKLTPEDVDGDFVRRVVEALPKDKQDQLIALRLLPLRYEPDAARGVLRLEFATFDPTRPEALTLLKQLDIEEYELTYAPESVVAPLLDELFPRQNEYLERLQEDEQAESFDLGTSYQQGGTQLVDEAKLEAEINRSSLINLFEASLVEAVRVGASDIHIFPNKRMQTEFHMRIDGELEHWHTQDKVHPESMLAVVKDRCLNIDRFDREIAQDGFIQRQVDDTLIRYRVSVLPVANARREVKSESIVIRVLDDRNVFDDLEQVGLLPGALKKFKKAIRQPNGMVIMTGPTGSGKSTTLAAALHQVISPKVNVLTVEDPVEYLIDGVRQIKLGPRLQFEGALRSILRHDPDIVMVGEMRDRITAELAIKLANTGHLTFSTLHTNDAPSAVSRLYKMGIEPFLLAYAINLIVAQRLLRRLCPECKKIDHDPDPVLMRELGFLEEEDPASITFFKPGDNPNCRTCRGQGYKGRRAVSEALYFTREIRHLIVEAGDTIDEDGIRDQAISEGMLTLLSSAREVVKLGDTSLEEVLRVLATE